MSALSDRPDRPVSRRRVLAGLAAATSGAILAACGNTGTTATTGASGASTTGTSPPAAGATTAPAPAVTASAPAMAATPPPASSMATASTSGTGPAMSPAAAATPRTASSKGELRVGTTNVNFPASLDPATDSFSLITIGMGETLMRLNVAGALEPWLAESMTNVSPTVWRITLRKNAKFWDGSPVDAEAVAASFRRNWDVQPSAVSFLSKDTQIAVKDPVTLELTTPMPVGNLPYNLVSQFFIVQKPGANGAILTGPYRSTSFVKDQQMTLEPFADHWAGPPALARITMKSVADANTRVLALQSGDLDMINGLPPESYKSFGPDIEPLVVPSTRNHMALLNLARPPFNDHAVREAFTIGIDRSALNTVGLEGKGAPSVGMFPTNFGVEVTPYPATDVARAKQVLEDAGWKAGTDGVRAKNGQRLALTLYSYSGRAELTPMAVSIQSQLKPLGFDSKVQEVQNITDQVKGGNFEAAMYSLNVLATGDPLYLFNVAMTKGGAYNYGGYTNSQLEPLVLQMRGEADVAKRAALVRQGQEIVRGDLPYVYLVVPPILQAARKGKLKNYVPHPDDLYFITGSMGVN